MLPDSKILLLGRGLVGSALARTLKAYGHTNVFHPGRTVLDLEDETNVYRYFDSRRPEYVFLAAAKVGGIGANSRYPADFIRSNLAIQTNVIEACHAYGVKKLLFLGSSCIYPRECPQPIREEYLLSGPLEPTNLPYAVAKIAGITMCQAYSRQYGSRFISAMPTNLYGLNDNYHLQDAHVLPALIRKVHEAKDLKHPSYTVWGSGKPLREFLYADDLAEACIFLMKGYEGLEPVNVGSGEEISILDLAKTVAECVGFKGEIRMDPSKPDGTPRKLLDSSKIRGMGWRPQTSLRDGIKRAYLDFLTGKVRK